MFVFWWCFSCGDSFADAVELKEMKEEQSGHEELVNTATSDWTSRLRHDRNNTSEFPWHVIYLTRFSTNMSEEVKNLTFRYCLVVPIWQLKLVIIKYTVWTIRKTLKSTDWGERHQKVIHHRNKVTNLLFSELFFLRSQSLFRLIITLILRFTHVFTEK